MQKNAKDERTIDANRCPKKEEQKKKTRERERGLPSFASEKLEMSRHKEKDVKTQKCKRDARANQTRPQANWCAFPPLISPPPKLPS